MDRDSGPTASGDPDLIRAAAAHLVAFGKRMVRDRLVVGSAGNLSVRVGDSIVITPSGVSYHAIRESDICVVDAAGDKASGDGRISSEYPMHRMIYDTSDARAIVHTHSTAAVAVSITCTELPAVHYSILRLGGSTVRVAPYQTFGSDGLAGAAQDALADRSAALLQNHGVIAYGTTLEEAYERAELVEWLCDIHIRAVSLGTPRILDADELAAVREQARRRRYEGAR
jgi:L-fuculose-phosphate aldolase